MHRKTVLPSQDRMEPEPVEKPKRVALVQEQQGLQAKMLQQPETQMDPEIMATRTGNSQTNGSQQAARTAGSASSANLQATAR